jgi:hypothetical protein
VTLQKQMQVTLQKQMQVTLHTRRQHQQEQRRHPHPSPFATPRFSGSVDTRMIWNTELYDVVLLQLAIVIVVSIIAQTMTRLAPNSGDRAVANIAAPLRTMDQRYSVTGP